MGTHLNWKKTAMVLLAMGAMAGTPCFPACSREDSGRPPGAGEGQADTGAGQPDGGTMEDSGGGEFDGGTIPDSILPGDWCLLWSDLFCTTVTRCTWPGALGWSGPGECESAMAAQCWYGRYLEDAVASGTVRFDTQAAKGCLEALRGVACHAFVEGIQRNPDGPVGECLGVIQGLAGQGQGCPLGVECGAGLSCRYDQGCPGQCLPVFSEGDLCQEDHQCDQATALCLGEQCRELPHQEGGACLQGYCRWPLVCAYQTETCGVLGGKDDPCHIHGLPCLPGLVCMAGASGQSSEASCVPLRGEGEGCFSDDQCGAAAASESGLGSLVCVGGECAEAPGAGEPCHGFLCHAGTWCDTTAIPPTCNSLPGQGQSCTRTGRCGAGLACRGEQCVPLGQAGDPCNEPWECLDGRCFGSVCVARDEPPCPWSP